MVASISAVRLWARRLARAGLRQATRRSPGIVGVLELEQVALVEQVHLQGAVVQQAADLAALQRGDPAEAFGLQLLDRSLRDHAAIADQHHVVQAELAAQLVGLRQQGRRVGGVALEHRDRHRTAAPVGQQSPVDLQLALLAVAVVAARGQRAVAALEVARGQVVQRQAARGEVPLRQLALDRVLAGEQPVHGAVELVLAGIGHAEILGQGAAVPPARRRQLGVGRHDAGRDHGHDEVGLAARPRRRAGPRRSSRRMARSTAAVSPCGREATISKRSPAGTNASPRSARRTMSTRLSGRCERLPSVSFLTLPSSRKLRRSRWVAVDAALVLARRGDDVNGSTSGRHPATIDNPDDECQIFSDYNFHKSTAPRSRASSAAVIDIIRDSTTTEMAGNFNRLRAQWPACTLPCSTLRNGPHAPRRITRGRSDLLGLSRFRSLISDHPQMLAGENEAKRQEVRVFAYDRKAFGKSVSRDLAISGRWRISSRGFGRVRESGNTSARRSPTRLLDHDEPVLHDRPASFIAALFTGLFIGTIACSFLADKFGRRAIFTYSLLWYSACTLILAFQTPPNDVNCGA